VSHASAAGEPVIGRFRSRICRMHCARPWPTARLCSRCGSASRCWSAGRWSVSVFLRGSSAGS